MKFKNLSVKQLFSWIMVGQAVSIIVITLTIFIFTKQTSVLLAGILLLLCTFIWFVVCAQILAKRLVSFTSDLCRTIDSMINKVSYRTKIHCFLHHLLKSCPVKFQQKRHQRSASGQSKRPRRQLRAPDAPNYVFHENRLSNMRKCRPDVKLTETLQMTLKRDIIVVRTSRFWYDNGML